MTDPGYKFISLPTKVNRTDRPEARHDRRVSTAITATLQVTLTAEQPVHVGSGFKTIREDRIVCEAITSRGVPCIPGSTIKGVLRSRYEAITQSCVLFEANTRPVKNQSRNYKEAEKAELSTSVRKKKIFTECDKSKEKLCAACALFGSMSLKSRVTISDFLPHPPILLEIAKVAEMFSPKSHHFGRKFACGHGPETGAKQLIEVIPANSRLIGTIKVANVTEAELGGLLAALGVRPESFIKLGSGKSHGFGRVRVISCVLVAHPADNGRIFDEPVFEKAFRGSSDIWPTGLEELISIHTGDDS